MACSASVVALGAATAAASSSNPKHFVAPNAVPTYGPNNYVVTFDGNGNAASYGTREVTGSLNLWSVGSSFTTKQEWTNMDDNRINDTTSATDASNGFIHGAGAYTTPTLSPILPGYITLSNNFYSSEGTYGAVATIANDGGPTGSLGGGTLLLMQTAAGLNPDYRPIYSVGDVTAEETQSAFGQINPGVLTITKADGSALPATPQTLLFNKNFQINRTPTSFGNLPYQELIWGVWLPSWTGDVKVGWEMPVHTMFSSLRVDTAVGTMNGAASLSSFVVGPPPAAATLYWDIDGTTAGAGGTAPSGSWNGSTSNFNTSAAGSTGGALRAATTSADTVVFSAGTGATGNYTVTVSGTREAAAVKFKDGNVTLSGGAVSTPSVEVSAGATASITSTLTSPTSALAKIGDGTLKVTKLPKNHAINVTGGRLQVADSSPTFPNHPSGDDAAVSRPKSLTLSSGATLDLGNNDLILAYGAGTPYNGTSPVAALEALVAQGFGANQDWTGAGITSSTAASEDAAGNFVIAIADNALLPQAFGVSNGGENFDGVVVPLESVLIKFTHRVDLNLDGLVNGDDAQIFSTNYDNGSPAYWSIGDLDYNGIFNSDDVQLFATYYDNTLQHLPEPSTLLVGGCIAAGFAGRRRRSN